MPYLVQDDPSMVWAENVEFTIDEHDQAIIFGKLKLADILATISAGELLTPCCRDGILDGGRGIIDALAGISLASQGAMYKNLVHSRGRVF